MSFHLENQFTAQIPMPGIPPIQNDTASSGNVYVGQEILYMSRRKGGPRVGARGIIKEILKRQAVVDLGASGTWHVPYSFLSVPHALNRNTFSQA